MAFLKTLLEFSRLPGTSLFDKVYSLQFELDHLRRPQSIPTAGLRISREICYHPRPDPANPTLQSLDLYAPEDLSNFLKPAVSCPVVMFMHGGGWRASDKNDPLGVHANVCKALALRGMVVANVNYRLAPRLKHPEPARDVAAAVSWIRKNFAEAGGDPEKIFLTGHSAGGHLAALLALDASYLAEVGLPADLIKGVIGISGVYNLPHFAGRNWMAEYLMTRAAFAGDGVRTAASPVNHVRTGAPPFLLFNAEKDERLEEEAEELARSLRAKEGVAETRVLRGTNHFTILSLVGNGDDTLVDEITAFVQGPVGSKQCSD